MFIDGLPIWGFIGKVEKLPSREGEREGEKLSLFTHVSRLPAGAAFLTDITVLDVPTAPRSRCRSCELLSSRPACSFHSAEQRCGQPAEPAVVLGSMMTSRGAASDTLAEARGRSRGGGGAASAGSTAGLVCQLAPR